ncbi:MAG: fatty acid CoA ligase family protein, partial [Nitrospinota bacterium]|nr:fatty acid CoA ligase family protein [Nitrospinota bacterium]
MDESFFNIAGRLEEVAAAIPEAPAIILPRGSDPQRISFRELHRRSNRLASGLLQSGVSRGHRVLLMVPPGVEFISLTFALFRIGAVPILNDPGLSRQNILGCVQAAEPDGMVAISLAHAVRLLFRKPFATIQTFVTVGNRWFWGGKTLAQVWAAGRENFEPAPTAPTDPAAILFTSGSTGPPKGVVYTHAMFAAQAEILHRCYGFNTGEVDLPTFPLFALFSIAMGMTCVFPEMNASQPAKADPQKIIGAVKQFNVTTSFGSPALWDTVSRYCLDHDVQLPTLKRILMAGAPVPGHVLQRFKKILKDGEIFTPYGATEALPVASISRSEILGETWAKTQQGDGVCVGQAVPGVDIKIIKIMDQPIPDWQESLETAQGEIGEIVVKSPWVTRHYFRQEAATQAAKIRDGDTFWHRMGDVGYLDASSRLWFCGRKSQRVIMAEKTLFTIPCEAFFNNH